MSSSYSIAMDNVNHDQLKSDDQMEMMMMTMMQMANKLPDFCGPYNDVASFSAEPPHSDIPAAVPPNCIAHPHNIHNAFLNLPSSIPFPSAVHDQPPHVQVPPFLSGSAAGTVGNNNNNNTNKWNVNDSINSPQKRNSMAAMREMIFRIAVMQPIHIDPESVKPPKRRNVKISKDPQSVAARHRRERISERIRILQRLVPGGTKMDTASMLDEAIHYVKFLKTQVQTLERAAATRPTTAEVTGIGFHVAMSTGSSYLNPNCVEKAYQLGATSAPQNVQHFGDA
ncbi:hypothetical protein L484_009547 [Morus notabilis]|uniref:BHLH domain-containing protein n=1 Tax=Morus notabilis TaxID=981085 RepID=W9SY98_9ROSA|nr:hypothetical protein L484_009547 [Morus notabilis]